MSMVESPLKRFTLDHEDLVPNSAEKPHVKRNNTLPAWQIRGSPRLQQQPVPSKHPLVNDGALIRRRSLFPTGAPRKVSQF